MEARRQAGKFAKGITMNVFDELVEELVGEALGQVRAGDRIPEGLSPGEMEMVRRLQVERDADVRKRVAESAKNMIALAELGMDGSATKH
jgi:cytosine/adenosine deaminase-related metal-dependent hydrolase